MLNNVGIKDVSHDLTKKKGFSLTLRSRDKTIFGLIEWKGMKLNNIPLFEFDK
jgi:hypothetical protein